jgi:phosphoribosylformylglycinamidine synthase PurS subunit
MAKVTVYVTLKPGLLDAQGRTVAGALHHLGYEDVAGVRIGKIIEMEFPEGDPEDLRARAASACEKLLANPVTETYRIEVTP